MAAIQIGDVVALGTLAWKIYNIGWSPEVSASAQYAAFGADVRGLAESLDVLTSVVNRARQSLVERGASPGRLRWDPQSLQDIVGDYNATLAECGQLLQRNRSYRETTGALGNIEWNILVQPQVDRLRPRLVLHNSRIQHAMKPFEIDLLTRVYEDLSRQIGEVRLAVYDVQELLNTLIGVLVPDLATALELRRARQICDVNIPEDMRHDFESTFNLHPSILDGGSPPLRDLADSFIDNFEKSTKLFYPGMTIDLMAPPVGQYICLLKCQFLMEKMRTANELLRASDISHWPAYLQSLEENLSYECYRFKRSMAPPDVSYRRQDMLLFWRPIEAVAEDEDFITQQLLLEDLLPDGLPLETASERQWKNVKLMRHLKSNDRRYRLVISSGKLYNTKADRRVVDFDIEKCALNPLYALPQGDSVARELWIEEGINTHRLVFVNLSDLLLFQQALTGYKVVDDHAEYRTKISVVTPDATVISDASVQLWIPRRLSGRPITDTSVANQSGSETSSVVGSIQVRRRSSNNSSTINMSPRPGQTSQTSVFSESPPTRTTMLSALSPLSTSPWSTMGPSRTASIVASPTSYTRPPSAMLQSITPPMSPPNAGIPARRPVGSGGGTPASTVRRDSNSTMRNSTLSLSAPSFKIGATSTSSSSSDHVTTVTLGPSAATSSSGVVHAKPLEPMLVLFVKDPTTFAHSLLAVTIDGDTRASPDLCKCQKTPHTCRITAIQQCGGKRPLKVWHLGGERQSKWDLLPLATVRRHQQGNKVAGGLYSTVIRLSILFQSPPARLKVGGCYCTCKIRTEGDEIICMQRGHMGLLGQVRMHYCRQMELWHQGRFRNHQNVVDRPPDD